MPRRFRSTPASPSPSSRRMPGRGRRRQPRSPMFCRPASRLSARSPATGNYDAATGIWTVGVLGQRRQRDADADGQGDFGERADHQCRDGRVGGHRSRPREQLGERHAQSRCRTLDVTQSILREARVLAFVGCGRSGNGSPPASTIVPISSLAYLRGLGYGVKVVADPAAFVNGYAQRTLQRVLAASDTSTAEPYGGNARGGFRGNTSSSTGRMVR